MMMASTLPEDVTWARGPCLRQWRHDEPLAMVAGGLAADNPEDNFF